MGETPLFYCHGVGKARLLIKARVDVNAKDIGEGTALFKSRNCNIVSALIETGADVNAKNKCEETALFSFIGNKETTKVLSDAGIDVNATNQKG